MGFCENLGEMGDSVRNRFVMACATTLGFFVATPAIYAQLWTAGFVMGAAALLGFIMCAIIANRICYKDKPAVEKLLGNCFPDEDPNA